MSYELDPFTRAYLECALWSCHDDTDPEHGGGDPLEWNYRIEDIHEDSLREMIAECQKFQEENAQDILLRKDDAYRASSGTPHETAGHLFWLNRNYHGCGFWDGDYLDEVGERLNKAAHTYPEKDLYVGDDGKIHQGSA